jgi:phage FluMu protein Com
MAAVPCPKCGEIVIKGGFETWQIVVAICLFPIGLLALLAGRKPTQCPKCKTIFQG